MKEEKAEMEAENKPETPNEFLHRELREFVTRCVHRGVPVSAFGSALLGCAIHATLTRKYFEMEPQVTAFMGKGGTA
jgi:hypothetical protein